MTQALPITRLVNVSVNLAPNSAQMQNISTLLILGSSGVIDTTERYRSYTSIAAVAADFGTSAPEYLAAVLWFEQSPQPITLQIGRWAQAASHGRLVGGTLSAAQQAMSAWTAITSGGFSITVDGTVQHLSALSFAAQTNLNGVATVINGALTGATVAWNANFNRFEVTDTSTGVLSVLSFASAPLSGTDISAMLKLTSADGGYSAPGIAVESALAAVSLFDANYGQNWYAVTVLGAADADHQAIAPAIEAMTNKHIYGVSTQEAGVLSSVSTTDIAYLLSAALFARTTVQYSSSNAYAVCSLLARILTTDYNANNSVITLMYKQEPGITPETLNASQVGALEAKGCNVFLAYNNSTAIIEPGVQANGTFTDIVTGTDWLALDIQTSVFNLLYTSTTKIPQTDQGNGLIVSVIEGECGRAVRNGLLAPGVWTAGGFGALSMGDFLAKGFYIYAPPIALQNPADRSARRSVTFQVAAKLAGAIHTANIIINVNR